MHKGDTLVILEDREYRLKLAEAEAELQNAVSGKTVMSSAISTTESNIGVNEASILAQRPNWRTPNATCNATRCY